MVVRANNGRWFTHDKVEDFVLKSTPHCPTYGVCNHCFGSGPVHMLCQKCRMKDQRYIIAKKNGKILDAEWVSQFFGISHLDLRADRTQNWISKRIWIVSRIQLEIYTQCRWAGGETLERGGSEVLVQVYGIIRRWSPCQWCRSMERN
jgi:hypothetical protein